MKLFNNVAGRKTPKSKFDLSHEVKTSFDMGQIIPVMNPKPINPGDNWRQQTEAMLRYSPMVFPIFHRINAYLHFFFVPNRLVWSDWEDFVTGGRDGTLLPELPTLTMNDANKNSFLTAGLADHMGLPTLGLTPMTATEKISALPFRGYQLIYQEYYQDQNLNAELGLSTASGSADAEIAELVKIRNRCWQRDYLTSCLPWAQRGGEASIPMDINESDINYKNPARALNSTGVPIQDGAPLQSYSGDIKGGGSNQDATIDNIDSIQAANLTVNDLRKSVRLQEWLERQARGGSRYIESILSHFGVRSSDQRLQRPEFIAAGRTPVVVSEVLNTTGQLGSEGVPQGEMSGHGISVGATARFNKRFEEHGYLFCLASIMPKSSYSQGIERHWTYKDKFDFYWPEFAQLGEQEVKNKEAYFDWWGTTPANDTTFGYQSRYAEYKHAQDQFNSSMRRQAGLDFAHFGRIFESPPVLNNEFVEANITKRPFAVQTSDPNIWANYYHNISAIRPMPYFGTPKL